MCLVVHFTWKGRFPEIQTYSVLLTSANALAELPGSWKEHNCKTANMEVWGRGMCLDLSRCAQDVKMCMCTLTKEKPQWSRIFTTGRQDTHHAYNSQPLSQPPCTWPVNCKFAFLSQNASAKKPSSLDIQNALFSALVLTKKLTSRPMQCGHWIHWFHHLPSHPEVIGWTIVKWTLKTWLWHQLCANPLQDCNGLQSGIYTLFQRVYDTVCPLARI